MRAMTLATSPQGARVALLPRDALLLAGDHVLLELEVGAGAVLEVVEPSGTVAYAMRGAWADWEVRAVLRPGARLVWHGAPFVVAESAGVRRTTTLDLGPGATCLLRETLVLGRQGEAPGQLVVDTKIALEGLPVLVEHFELGPEALVPGVLGQARVMDQIMDFRPYSAQAPTGMLLEPYGVLYRRLGRAAHDASLDDVWHGLV
jgi:urease accessory protein